MYRFCFAGLSLFGLSIFACDVPPAESHQSAGPVATTVVVAVDAVQTVGANVAGRMAARQAYRQNRPWRQRVRARAAGYGSAGYAVRSYGSHGSYSTHSYSSHSYGSHGMSAKPVETSRVESTVIVAGAPGCPGGVCPQ
jgi:hypothetical protein